MQKPKISIIIPVLNVALTLERAINSFINQTYKKLELIIIDGGSLDETCKIINQFQFLYPNITLICEKEDGIYDAMNKGIDASTGDWLYFMGADDELFDENVLSDLVSSGIFDQDKIVYGNVQIIGNNNWANDGDIYDGPFDLKKLLTKNICQQAIFYPRRVFNNYGKFDLIFKIISDWDFNLRCWAQEEFAFFDRMIAKFSTGGKSSIIENNESYIRLIKKISNYFNENIFDEKNYLPESIFANMFVYYQKRKTFLNHNIENTRDGISLFTAVKNRSDLFEEALQTWITHTEINEIVVVDWSSDQSIQPLIEKYNDGRIILVRIENQGKWILSKAFNIAAKFTSYNKILKIDADVKIHVGFFLHHILTPSIFISGDWQNGRNENETHLCGNFFSFRSDFFKAGGFNENITMYGYDDSDLYSRLNDIGLEQHFIDYDYLYHIEHCKRMSCQNLPAHFIGLSDNEWARFNILKNRSLLKQLDKWTWENDTCDFKLMEANGNYFKGEIEDQSESLISDEQNTEAEYVAAKDRLIELNSFNLDFLLSDFSKDQIVEIYYMHVQENDQHKQKQLEIFEKLNQLQYQGNLDKLGLENEIDLLKHLIEIKDDVARRQGEEIIALQNEIDEKIQQLDQNHKLLADSLQNINVLYAINNENEQKIQAYQQQISDISNKLTVRINSIENENILLHKQLINNNEIINKLTSQQNAIYQSITYKLIRITALIFIIFKPRLIIHKFNTWLNNRRNCRLIANSSLFDQAYYLQNNEDILNSGMNPAKHYLLHGGFECRNPSANFNSSFYLSNNPDVDQASINPLLHYIMFGKDEGRKFKLEPLSEEKRITETHKQNISDSSTILDEKNNFEISVIIRSGLFDSDYYYRTYPDVKNAGIDALIHYYFNGWKELRNPGEKFDTNFYLSEYEDVKQSGMNPLYHYIKYGQNEGRSLRQRNDINQITGIDFEVPQPISIGYNQLPIKTIAFYLPQYHPIPENDLWWGKGFTEWINVAKAKPQFEGHYQPHIPADLGFYDLRLPEVMLQQIEMAKKFGIFGFCFYYYWFGGERLLEKPLDIFLNHPEWDFNFCVCWANENWTRRWDGMENEILIGQNHSPEDDVEFIKDVSKYFQDQRYIKVNEKPVLVIYRPGLFPNCKETVKRWRDYYKDHFNGELFLAMVQGFGSVSPFDYGFDAAIEFPPHNFELKIITDQFNSENFNGYIIDSLKIIDDSKGKLKNVDYNLIRGVMLNWDNTPRRNNQSHIYLNNSPHEYEKWLSEAIIDTLQNINRFEHPFVFINAWNEWAEGCHLEPDQKYGYAYLNATQRAITKGIFQLKKELSTTEIVFVSHDACLAGAQLVLLDIVKWLSFNTCLKLKVLFLAGGELFYEFSKYSETQIIDFSSKEPLENQLKELINQKTALIYINSFASGRIIKTLSSFNIPVLTHVHELQKSIQIYANDWANDVIKFSDHFIACSNAVLSNLRDNYQINIDKISLVHAFVNNEIDRAMTKQEKSDLKRKLDLPDKKIVAGAGLGLFWRKGVDLFIEVCHQINEKYRRDDILFIWIGECSGIGNNNNYGKWEENLMRIEKFGLTDKIKFIGTVHNVRDYLKVSELFLLPSREDPFPLVCLEAADCFLPVICFDKAGGMPEFIKNDAGFTVAYEDVSDMAEKTILLIDNVLENKLRGELAHFRFVENYSVKASMQNILKAIRKIGNIHTLVSIIVPNYNYGVYLTQRLESIYNQTYQDFELIILDDCSTDNSMEVIENYRNRPFTSISMNDKNSGSVFHQWKKGVELANGEFIWIAEADDYCETNFLENLLPHFIDPKVNLVYCNSNSVNDQNVVIDHFYNKCNYYDGLGYDKSKWNNDYVNFGIDEIQNVLAIKNTIPNCSAVVFRKEAFLSIDVKNIEQMNCSHDWLTYIDLIKKGKIAYLSQPLNYHRRHLQSVIAQNTRDYKKTLSEYFLSHFYILKNFDIDKNNQERMVSFVKTNLFTIWTDISEAEKEDAYPLNDNTAAIIKANHKHKHEGFCPVCSHQTIFYSDVDWFRDYYRCILCNSIPRERALFFTLDQMVPDWRNMTIHESSPSNNYFKKAASNYSFSQYIPDKKLGSLVNGVLNENIELLTFKDNSFNIFLSADVLEHVFNPQKALKEMLRVTKQKGFIIFTTPIHKNLLASNQRASQLKDGSIKHLLPEMYHGNPVGDGKALVTWDYGQDFSQLVKQWIGDNYDIKILNFEDIEFGIIGEYLDVVLISKF